MPPAGTASRSSCYNPPRRWGSRPDSRAKAYLRETPARSSMPRFILRYRGQGARPQGAVDKIRGIGGASVLEDSDRMMLVEAPEQELREAFGAEADWIVTPEIKYEVPDTRKKVRRP